MAGAAVFASALTKHFGDLIAVDGVHFEVARGETFGLLGPNGAGKTSIMHIISCISPPTSGELRVLGMDPVADEVRIRGRLGICPQSDRLDHDLTVRENLVTYARYFGISRVDARQRATELLEFAQLSERMNDRVETLSGGMKRRLTIARTMVNDPEMIILDEPTTGLDPQARHLLWERLFRLKQRGITLLLSTHYMDEAEQLCDRLIILDRGTIVAEGAPRALIAQHTSPVVVELRFGTEAANTYSGKLEGIGDHLDALPDRLLIYGSDEDGIITEVHRRGLTPSSVLTRRSTLEDVFLRLTGRTLVE
ncbi:ABC transporter ATP-binding protein [Plantactinospora sp. KLBMP9567]|uniref:ABC transporter ATP-binding protein n=1 Tax=Plantactinospora sp. KLBMP9567 TaxID=3085900 RepID=UPI0029811EE3|nr:ABC transporter ATP-binding protein [Plantactinospora sp. KLBMP9567]MDW5329512.1 ABC transporter ATP-binding protein [Plantactinospora sp. KLBMP9567]